MRGSRTTRATACALAVTAVAALPAGIASASDASIKAAIVSYDSRISEAEGRVVQELGKYAETKDAAPLDAAIANSMAVLGGLEHKVDRQAARASRVKRAKRRIVLGLGDLVTAYGQLETAYNEIATQPEAARTRVASAKHLVLVGRWEFLGGVRLLK